MLEVLGYHPAVDDLKTQKHAPKPNTPTPNENTQEVKTPHHKEDKARTDGIDHDGLWRYKKYRSHNTKRSMDWFAPPFTTMQKTIKGRQLCSAVNHNTKHRRNTKQQRKNTQEPYRVSPDTNGVNRVRRIAALTHHIAISIKVPSYRIPEHKLSPLVEKKSW